MALMLGEGGRPVRDPGQSLQSEPCFRHAPSMVGPPLLFDLDGTLLDTLGDLADAANAARSVLGLPPVADELVAPHIGWGLGHLLSHVLPAGAESVLPTARAAFMEHYASHLLVRSTPYPGADELMANRGDRFVGLVTISRRAS